MNTIGSMVKPRSARRTEASPKAYAGMSFGTRSAKATTIDTRPIRSQFEPRLRSRSWRLLGGRAGTVEAGRESGGRVSVQRDCMSEHAERQSYWLARKDTHLSADDRVSVNSCTRLFIEEGLGDGRTSRCRTQRYRTRPPEGADLQAFGLHLPL